MSTNSFSSRQSLIDYQVSAARREAWLRIWLPWIDFHTLSLSGGMTVYIYIKASWTHTGDIFTTVKIILHLSVDEDQYS